MHAQNDDKSRQAQDALNIDIEALLQATEELSHSQISKRYKEVNQTNMWLAAASAFALVFGIFAASLKLA